MKLPTIFTALGLLLTPVLSDNTLNIVAHPDDDLLFLNPDILHDISSGYTLRTVYLTSGDAGLDWPYWTGRQAGVLAAYAQMAGVESVWDEGSIEYKENYVALYTLRDKPQVSLAFLHLPDGSIDGDGFDRTDHESLEKLWKEKIDRIYAIDESGTTYTRDELIDTLRHIINQFHPDSINSLDYLHDFGTGDHSDHTSTGLFANEAAIAATEYPGTVIAYEGYPIKYEAPNVDGEDLEKKKAAFYTYAGYDPDVCASDAACTGKEYEDWLQRLYTAN